MDEVEKNPEDLILLPFDERAPLNTMEPTNPAGGSAVAGADSQLSSPEFAKPGQVLRLNEVALQNIDERALFLPLLRLEYGISFAPNILQGSTSISFTSRKSILSAESGDRFFLKEKPLYCCAKSRLKLSADFQNYLASNLDFVTPLIRTISGEDYVRIGTRTFFLTRYTSGSIFSGRALQSLSCAEALARLHRCSFPFVHSSKEPVFSVEQSRIFVRWISEFDWPAKELHRSVETILLSIIDRCGQHSSDQNRMAYCHGDFAPFNMVFDGDRVVAVHDFDSAAYSPIVRDVAIMLLTHGTIYYKGSTSLLNEPIQTTVDVDRVSLMLKRYCATNPLIESELRSLPYEAILHWVELLGLGLIRGDFSLASVRDAVFHVESLLNTFRDIINRTALDRNLNSKGTNL